MIYFDNAATTFPKPQCIKKAVVNAMEKYGANPGRSGHDFSIATAEEIFKTRMSAAKLFNAVPEKIIFTKNCTEALNIGIKGCVRKGDHVIISDLEHNSVSRPIHKLWEDGTITYSVAETFATDQFTIDSIEKLIKPQTRLIICTHASNAFGIKLPITQIGALARRHNVKFMVDAAQSAGVLDIDMKKDRIDYLCMPGHKGLYGLPGTGMLIISGNENLATVSEGGTGSYSMSLKMPTELPERLETGTINTIGIISMGAGIEHVLYESCESILEKEMKVAQRLYDGLMNTDGVKVYGFNPKLMRSVPVVSFNIKDWSSERTCEGLNELGFALRGGFHCAMLAHNKMKTDKQGVARASIGMFNTPRQADKLVNAVEKLASLKN